LVERDTDSYLKDFFATDAIGYAWLAFLGIFFAVSDELLVVTVGARSMSTAYLLVVQK